MTTKLSLNDPTLRAQVRVTLDSFVHPDKKDDFHSRLLLLRPLMVPEDWTYLFERVRLPSQCADFLREVPIEMALRQGWPVQMGDDALYVFVKRCTRAQILRSLRFGPENPDAFGMAARKLTRAQYSTWTRSISRMTYAGRAKLPRPRGTPLAEDIVALVAADIDRLPEIGKTPSRYILIDVALRTGLRWSLGRRLGRKRFDRLFPGLRDGSKRESTASAEARLADWRSKEQKRIAGLTQAQLITDLLKVKLPPKTMRKRLTRNRVSFRRSMLLNSMRAGTAQTYYLTLRAQVPDLLDRVDAPWLHRVAQKIGAARVVQNAPELIQFSTEAEIRLMRTMDPAQLLTRTWSDNSDVQRALARRLPLPALMTWGLTHNSWSIVRAVTRRLQRALPHRR